MNLYVNTYLYGKVFWFFLKFLIIYIHTYYLFIYRFIEETRSTLQFASRAKLVITNALVNEVVDDATKLRRITRELERLKV
jgi:hypothetical protein